LGAAGSGCASLTQLRLLLLVFLLIFSSDVSGYL
jgi:hypothetical protein